MSHKSESKKKELNTNRLNLISFAERERNKISFGYEYK